MNIINSNEEDLKEIYKKVKDEKDELLRKILNSIITFEYWKTKYYKENKEKYFEQVLKNLDKVFKEIELSLWMLLYLKNKEKVLNYLDYIEKLSDEILLSSDIFIEENLKIFKIVNKEKILKEIEKDKSLRNYIEKIKEAINELESNPYSPLLDIKN